MTSLENQFHRAMISVYKNAKKHDYFATYFKRLLDEYQGLIQQKDYCQNQRFKRV